MSARRRGACCSIPCCRRFAWDATKSSQTPGALCAACWQGFAFVAPPYCARCGVPFAEDLGPRRCAAPASPGRRAFAAPAPRCSTTTRAVVCVLPFKHGDRTDIARACGRWMARRRRRASGRGRPGRAGAAPLAPAVHPPLQSGAAAGASRVAGRGARPRLAPDLLRRRRWTGSQAGCAPRSGGAMSGRPSTSIRAGRRRWQGQDRPAGRRRADHRGDGRGLRPRFAARRGPAR